MFSFLHEIKKIKNIASVDVENKDNKNNQNKKSEKKNIIIDQNKIRDLDKLIFEVFLSDQKNIDKKELKKVYKDLNKLVIENN